MSRRVSFSLPFAAPFIAVFAACTSASPLDTPDAAWGEVEGETAEAGVPTCRTVADCPPPLGNCVTAACTAGLCGEAALPAGHVPADAGRPGNCTRVECDGEGFLVPVEDLTDVPEDDVIGNCQTPVCEGIDEWALVPDATDVPPSDGNVCLAGACAAGLPMKVPVNVGQPCELGVCNTAGECAPEGGWTAEYTLVTLLAVDASDPIARSHEVRVLDSTTGLELDPPVRVMSTQDTGALAIPIPAGVVPSFHILGSGTGASDTYDSIVLGADPRSGETLLRISNVGLAETAGNVAGYAAQVDRAELWGKVYHRPGGGPRVGTVGCARVYLDGDTTGELDDVAQRYAGASGLPHTLEQRTHTNRSGGFVFGNIDTGNHTLRVSVDGGATFLAETQFVISHARQDALGPHKSIRYELAVDIDTTTDPTPADCPLE